MEKVQSYMVAVAACRGASEAPQSFSVMPLPSDTHINIMSQYTMSCFSETSPLGPPF